MECKKNEIPQVLMPQQPNARPLKNLVYLASGGYREGYDPLLQRYERLIFIDHANGLANSFPSNHTYKVMRFTTPPPPAHFRGYIFIGMDVLMAIRWMQTHAFQIDCLVSVNEGLFQGGGEYPVLSHFVLGYLAPLLKPEFLLVWNPRYYLIRRLTELRRWAIGSAVALQEEHAAYISPSLFMEHEREGGKVCRLTKADPRRLSFKVGHCEIVVANQSVWEEAAEYHWLGMLLPRYPMRHVHNRVSDFFKDQHPVFDLWQDDHPRSFISILEEAVALGKRRIALCPWLNHNYEAVIQCFEAGAIPPSIEKIAFYHWNPTDLAGLRSHFYLLTA